MVKAPVGKDRARNMLTEATQNYLDIRRNPLFPEKKKAVIQKKLLTALESYERGRYTGVYVALENIDNLMK